jgi:DNA-binding transcriptional ArsR family regulator
MSQPQSTRSTETRRRWLVLLGVVVVIGSLWAVTSVTAAGADAPVETPTPPVETPVAANDSVGPVVTATPPATVTTPTRPGTPAVRNGSAEVRTAVEGSAGYVDSATDPRGSWTGVDEHLARRGAIRSTATPRDARDSTATAVPAETTATDRRSSPSPTPTVTPASAGGCVFCGPMPAGVVLLGLAGGAGAAASLGLSSQSTLGPSSPAVRHWVDRRLPRLPPVLPGRFGRGDDADPLAHTHRRQLRELVDDRPGVHLAGVVDELPLSRSSVRYHVRVLEDAGELETANLLGRRRLFPPDADSELLAALADDGSRRVVQAVARVEPASVGEVVDETDRAYSTVSYHLDRLAAAGVVDRERDGRRVTIRLTDDVAGVGSADGVAAD